MLLLAGIAFFWTRYKGNGDDDNLRNRGETLEMMDNPMRSPAAPAAAPQNRPPAVVTPTHSRRAPAGGGGGASNGAAPSSSTTTANASQGDVVYLADAGNNTYDAWGTSAPVYAVPTSKSKRATNGSGGGVGAGAGESMYATAAHPTARQTTESAEYSHLSQDPAHRQHNNVQIQQEDQNNLYDLGPPQRRGQRGGQQQQPEQNNLYDLGPQQQRGNQTNA